MFFSNYHAGTSMGPADKCHKPYPAKAEAYDKSCNGWNKTTNSFIRIQHPFSSSIVTNTMSHIYGKGISLWVTFSKKFAKYIRAHIRCIRAALKKRCLPKYYIGFWKEENKLFLMRYACSKFCWKPRLKRFQTEYVVSMIYSF